MILSRKLHSQFLNDELKAQTDEFKQKLETSATYLLLEKHIMFVAQYVKFLPNGEMILKFNASRPLPRKNDHLYCFTLPDAYKRYKDWGNLTYGDLIKKETQATEIKCIWHSKSDDTKFMLAGFKGVSEDFKKWVENVPGGIVTLGPQVPPFEYISNLIKVTNSNNPKCCEILDADYIRNCWTPELLKTECNMTELVMNDFKNSDIVIIQGPPGTGKTFRIANLIETLCNMNKSVLVTSLTNRALMEVAEKLHDSQMMKDERVYKTNLTTDEAKEVSGILNSEKVSAIPGKLMLSTFYISSGVAANNINTTLFDYVIVDEASQAFLPMLAAAHMLGKKNLWVGDIKQMQPIVLISNDRVNRLGYNPIIEGLDTLTSAAKFKTYQLADTYRLGDRAARFTGMFYNNTLKSKSELNGTFSKEDGPILIPMDMPLGDPKPKDAIQKAVLLAKQLLAEYPSKEIAILSQLVKTTSELQSESARQIGISNKLLIETVARIQGITKDFTIYVIPDTDAKIHSLELRLFNVATSRARYNTYIICPKTIMKFSYMPQEVRSYLTQAFLQNENANV